MVTHKPGRCVHGPAHPYPTHASPSAPAQHPAEHAAQLRPAVHPVLKRHVAWRCRVKLGPREVAGERDEHVVALKVLQAHAHQLRAARLLCLCHEAATVRGDGLAQVLQQAADRAWQVRTGATAEEV
jgi:hypothetical protein